MFSTLRTRFGIPGVISVMALVFAMIGGAYAANSSSDSGKATASAKAKQGPRGPKGPKGAKGDTGPVGPAGAQGPAGAAGPKGDAGAKGDTGSAGTPGTSAEAVSFSGAKGGCTEGGTEVKSAKPATFVCNGKKGTDGQTGFTEVLPPGKTETGMWGDSYRNDTEGFSSVYLPISFTIPMPQGAENKAFYLDKEETEQEVGTGGCTGTAQEPTAPPGVLCVYTLAERGNPVIAAFPLFNGGEGYLRSGAALEFFMGGTLPSVLEVAGSWAVTAPAAS